MTTLTYSETYDEAYVDWRYIDNIGTGYTSYLITGPKVHGQGIKVFQGNWLVLYLEVEENASGYVQYLWDFANNSAGHRFSQAEQIYLTRQYASASPRRVWLRGQGRVLQIKIYSQAGKPFTIYGWSMFETGNTQP